MDIDEFQCRCNACPSVEPDENLLAIIDAVERHFGKEIVISSGMRCPPHNATIPGASSKSSHTLAKAVDCYMPGVELGDLYRWLDLYSPYPGGLGLYRGHVHIDARGYPARWNTP